MAPTAVEEPLAVGSGNEEGTIEPFDVCDIVTGEEPIECMKLIYKKIAEFEECVFDLKCFDELPTELIKQVCRCTSSRSELAEELVEMGAEVRIVVFDQIE
jgi:hypothetical protein